MCGLCEDAMTNILSMCDVEQHGHNIDHNTKRGRTFCVTAPDGRIVKFKPSPSGSHCHDTRESAISVLNTVKENESGCSARERSQASTARRLHHMTMHPSIQDHKMAVETHAVRNCPVTRRDIEITEDIWGPTLEPLKGKTTRKKPTVAKHDCVAKPKHTQEKQKDAIHQAMHFASKAHHFLSQCPRAHCLQQQKCWRIKN